MASLYTRTRLGVGYFADVGDLQLKQLLRSNDLYLETMTSRNVRHKRCVKKSNSWTKIERVKLVLSSRENAFAFKTEEK